jgi:hypothetical protein
MYRKSRRKLIVNDDDDDDRSDLKTRSTSNRRTCWKKLFHHPFRCLLRYSRSSSCNRRRRNHFHCEDDSQHSYFNGDTCHEKGNPKRREIFHGRFGWWRLQRRKDTCNYKSIPRKIPSSPDVTTLISYEEIGDPSSSSSSRNSSRDQIKIPHIFAHPSTSNPSKEYSDPVVDKWENPTKTLFPYWETADDSQEHERSPIATISKQKTDTLRRSSQNKLRILLNEKIRFDYEDSDDDDKSATHSDMASGFFTFPAVASSVSSSSSVQGNVLKISHSMKSSHSSTSAAKIKETTKQLLCACSSGGGSSSHHSQRRAISKKIRKSKHHQKVGSAWGETDNGIGAHQVDEINEDDDLCSYNFSISSDRDSSAFRPVKIQVVTNNTTATTTSSEYEEHHISNVISTASSTSNIVGKEHDTNVMLVPITDVHHPVNIYVTTTQSEETNRTNEVMSESKFLPTMIAWPDDLSTLPVLSLSTAANTTNPPIKCRSSSISLDEFMSDNKCKPTTETIVFCHPNQKGVGNRSATKVGSNSVPSINLADVSAADSASVGSTFLSVSYDDEYPQLVLRDSNIQQSTNNKNSVDSYEDDFFRTLSAMHDDFFHDKQRYSPPRNHHRSQVPYVVGSPKLGIAFGHPKASHSYDTSSSSSSSLCSYMIPSHSKKDAIHGIGTTHNMKRKKCESQYMSWLNQKIDQVLDKVEREDEIEKKISKTLVQLKSRRTENHVTKTIQTQSSSEWEDRDDANWSYFKDDGSTIEHLDSFVQKNDSHPHCESSQKKDLFEPILKPIVRFVVATQLPAPPPPPPPPPSRTSSYRRETGKPSSQSGGSTNGGSKYLSLSRIHNNSIDANKQKLMKPPPPQESRSSNSVPAPYSDDNHASTSHLSPPWKSILTKANASKYTAVHTPHHSPYRRI